MIIDAIVDSRPNDMYITLIRKGALLEAFVSRKKACKASQNTSNWVAAMQSVLVLCAKLLILVDDQQEAAKALGQAIAMCEPSRGLRSLSSLHPAGWQ